METIGEIIPFAKEMLNQRPGRGMLKIYMIGSTLAMLGVVGGLVETVLQPFVQEQETVEDSSAERIGEVMTKKEKHTTLVDPEDVDVLEMVETKAKHPGTACRRNSYRLHAS
ncbi:G0/G1 switch protein 2 [Etheostoma spectabile]|uniref:G0/G1 switch protein 2 n=1 Tax=Etheostoma spectabile TaxID=54343 RepID=UPI0013AFCEE9|nr:G0/G1 switch protein 2-like [Etheostoma spectabile]